MIQDNQLRRKNYKRLREGNWVTVIQSSSIRTEVKKRKSSKKCGIGLKVWCSGYYRDVIEEYQEFYFQVLRNI